MGRAVGGGAHGHSASSLVLRCLPCYCQSNDTSREVILVTSEKEDRKN